MPARLNRALDGLAGALGQADPRELETRVDELRATLSLASSWADAARHGPLDAQALQQLAAGRARVAVLHQALARAGARSLGALKVLLPHAAPQALYSPAGRPTGVAERLGGHERA